MNKRKIKRGWLWAFKKIKSYDCSTARACYLATVYMIKGDTGVFGVKNSYTRFRIKR